MDFDVRVQGLTTIFAIERRTTGLRHVSAYDRGRLISLKKQKKTGCRCRQPEYIFFNDGGLLERGKVKIGDFVSERDQTWTEFVAFAGRRHNIRISRVHLIESIVSQTVCCRR